MPRPERSRSQQGRTAGCRAMSGIQIERINVALSVDHRAVADGLPGIVAALGPGGNAAAESRLPAPLNHNLLSNKPLCAWLRSRQPSWLSHSSRGEPLGKRLFVHLMAGELSTVDQHDRNMIAVPPLQIWIVIDIDDGDFAAAPGDHPPDDPQRRIAQMAAGPRQEFDLRLGHGIRYQGGCNSLAIGCYRNSTSLRLKIFPVGPRGRSARMTTRRGTL